MFLEENDFFFKIRKTGKFGVECLKNDIISIKTSFFLPKLRFECKKKLRNFSKLEKFQNLTKKDFFLEKTLLLFSKATLTNLEGIKDAEKLVENFLENFSNESVVWKTRYSQSEATKLWKMLIVDVLHKFRLPGKNLFSKSLALAFHSTLQQLGFGLLWKYATAIMLWKCTSEFSNAHLFHNMIETATEVSRFKSSAVPATFKLSVEIRFSTEIFIWRTNHRSFWKHNKKSYFKSPWILKKRWFWFHSMLSLSNKVLASNVNQGSKWSRKLGQIEV